MDFDSSEFDPGANSAHDPAPGETAGAYLRPEDVALANRDAAAQLNRLYGTEKALNSMLAARQGLAEMLMLDASNVLNGRHHQREETSHKLLVLEDALTEAELEYQRISGMSL